ncbi:MAG: glycosyltransferase family 4 protein [Chitinophagales bacterium]
MSVDTGKKILYIVQHRFNRSPGQRYRCEQYIKMLEKNGFSCTYSPIITNEEEDKSLYQSRSLFAKGTIFLKAIYRRLKDVIRASQYDIVFVYREAFMTGSLFFEKRLKAAGAKLVYDFDDAIWLPDVSEVNKSLAWLKRPGKTADIAALSDLVIVGNTYLASYATNYNKNTVVFPSTIDMDYYRLPSGNRPYFNTGKVVIGWSGSHTTIKHFETILPVFEALRKKYGERIHFVVYGDPHYTNDALAIEALPWSHESEVDVIASFDIGIMPLPDNEWSKGKCAMKGLQYMGLSVPAVMSPVGMNTDVVQDGVNGFLAAEQEEWIEKLSLLIDNTELRKRIGAEGRKTVEEKFSVQALESRYLQIINSVLK